MKRIFFSLIIGIIAGYWIKANNIGLNNVQQVFSGKTQQAVKGAHISSVSVNFSEIQKAVQTLPISDIATSSPQVQTLINLLQKYQKGK